MYDMELKRDAYAVRPSKTTTAKKESKMSCFKCNSEPSHVIFRKGLKFHQQLMCRTMDPKAKGHFWLVCRDCWEKAPLETKAKMIFVRISG